MSYPGEIIYKGYDEEIIWPDAIEVPLHMGRKALHPVHTHKAIVDQEDNSLIAVVSTNYQLILHEDILASTEEAFHKLGWGQPEREITVIKEGARVVARYGFPEKAYNIRGADGIFPQITLRNSYDLSWVQALMAGIFRLVCSNGAYVGEMTNKMKRRHIFGSAGFDNEFFKTALDSAIASIDMTKRSFDNWLELPLKNAHLKAINNLKLNNTEIHNLSNLQERTSRLTVDMVEVDKDEDGTPIYEWQSPGVNQTTVFDFYNLMTEFTTHHIPSAMKREHYSEKVRNMFHSGHVLQLAA